MISCVANTRVPTSAVDAKEDVMAANETWRGSIAEFIATLLFIFLGAGTVVVTGGLLNQDRFTGS